MFSDLSILSLISARLFVALQKVLVKIGRIWLLQRLDPEWSLLKLHTLYTYICNYCSIIPKFCNPLCFIMIQFNPVNNLAVANIQVPLKSTTCVVSRARLGAHLYGEYNMWSYINDHYKHVILYKWSLQKPPLDYCRLSRLSCPSMGQQLEGSHMVRSHLLSGAVVLSNQSRFPAGYMFIFSINSTSLCLLAYSGMILEFVKESSYTLHAVWFTPSHQRCTVNSRLMKEHSCWCSPHQVSGPSSRNNEDPFEAVRDVHRP